MKKKIVTILLFVIVLEVPICKASLLIITHNYNQPSFIELQYKTFKKFLSDDFEYVVFNDALDPQLSDQIDSMCSSLGIACYRIPQENRASPQLKTNLKKGVFWAAARHGQAIRYSMETLGFHHQGLVMMIDSDMFLIKPFNAENFMHNHDIAGLQQIRDNSIRYLWGGLIFFRMDTLTHKKTMQFNNGLINGTYVDSCGFLHYYFQENPTTKILYFEQDFRHFLDEHLRNYSIPTRFYGNNFKSWPTYLQCSACKKEKNFCSHNAFILKEFGFDERIVSSVNSNLMPPKIEFVLRDTFLHFQDGTNYSGASLKFIEHKKELFFKFMKVILDDYCFSCFKRE